jgi:hypothetical protein
MMASKAFLTERIKELESQLKQQKDGNFLLKQKADKLIILNANLQKELNQLKKEKKRKRFIFW